MRKKSQAKRQETLLKTADLLLAKLTEGIGMTEPDNLAALKNAASVLKELKEIQMVRSEADCREQEARIAGLWKKAEPSDRKAEGTVEVLLPSAAEEWCC